MIDFDSSIIDRREPLGIRGKAIVRNRKIQYRTTPPTVPGGPSVTRAVNSKNGIQCCCGGPPPCSSCCSAGVVQNPCCYSFAQMRNPQLAFYYAYFYIEDPENIDRTGEAEFTMVGGPYDITGGGGICTTTILVDGTWRNWAYNNNEPITFTNQPLVLPPGFKTADPTRWPMKFPTHPDQFANNWSPRDRSPLTGSWGCDFADADGPFDPFTIPGYFNPLSGTGIYRALVTDSEQQECVFNSPICECLS